MVHRWLHEVQSGEDDARAELSTEALLEDLNQTAAHASMQAETAEMAETAVKDLKVCQFMEPHIGERLDARVVRVSRGGLEVHLVDFNVGGFLPARSMGQRPRVEGATLTVRVGKRVLSFTEGYAIRVEIKAVDFIRLQVLLELAT
jgi:exoribonuclease R